jgi:restriction endonuclease S subunit
VVQAKDIGESGTVDVTAAIMVADQRAKANHLLKRGDVVFQPRGAAIRAGLVAEEVMDTVAAAPLQIIRPDVDQILPEFLVLALNMPTTIAALLQQARGSHVPQVPLEVVRSVCLPLPDLNRQAAIVALARLIDAEKRTLEEIVALRSRLLEAVVQRAPQTPRAADASPGENRS